MVLPELIAGALLLTLGKRLFWLFVAGTGFLTGLQLAPRLLPGGSDNLYLIAALLLALIGALLAVLVQHFAVGLAGFLVGGYAALYIARAVGLLSGAPSTAPTTPTASLATVAALAAGGVPVGIVFLVGGIIGALLVAALFGLALVLLSSLAGSWLVVMGLKLQGSTELAVFLILVAAGIIFQTRVFGGRR